MRADLDGGFVVGKVVRVCDNNANNIFYCLIHCYNRFGCLWLWYKQDPLTRAHLDLITYVHNFLSRIMVTRC